MDLGTGCGERVLPEQAGDVLRAQRDRRGSGAGECVWHGGPDLDHYDDGAATHAGGQHRRHSGAHQAGERAGGSAFVLLV